MNYMNLNPGSAIVVRSTRGYIAGGEIGDVNDIPDLSGGDWVLSIPDATVWNVSNNVAELVRLDYGPDRNHLHNNDREAEAAEDWEGPNVSIGVGNDDADRELRIPDPVWSPGGIEYYYPQPVGAVTAVSTGETVDLSSLLDSDECPPRETRERK